MLTNRNVSVGKNIHSVDDQGAQHFIHLEEDVFTEGTL